MIAEPALRPMNSRFLPQFFYAINRLSLKSNLSSEFGLNIIDDVADLFDYFHGRDKVQLLEMVSILATIWGFEWQKIN
jgi:hypothetical protein